MRVTAVGERHRLAHALVVPVGAAASTVVDDVVLARSGTLTAVAVGDRATAAEHLLARVAACTHPTLAPVLDAGVVPAAAPGSGPFDGPGSAGSVAWWVSPATGVSLATAGALALAAPVAWGVLAAVAAAADTLHRAGLAHGRIGLDSVVLCPGPLEPSAVLAHTGVASLLALTGSGPIPSPDDDAAGLERLATGMGVQVEIGPRTRPGRRDASLLAQVAAAAGPALVSSPGS